MTYLLETLLFCDKPNLKEILPKGKKGNWPQAIYDALLAKNGWEKPNPDHEITPVNGLDNVYEVTLNDGTVAGLRLYEDWTTKETSVDIFKIPDSWK